jgi:predicted hydrocarbon binding protein
VRSAWDAVDGQQVCHLNIGSVAEAVRWVNEQEHEIIETQCIAKVDKYCRFGVGEIKV